METVNEDKIKCCSLCHQPCRDFSKIDQNTSETIVNLFLRPDISAINQDAVICVRCTNNLLVCSQLKSRCLYSESIIKSFASSKGNLFTDLIEVYLIINEDIRKDDIPKGHTVCRLCLTLIDYESCIYLNDDSKSGTSISILFFKYFPELDLNICKNPVICLPCHSILQTYLNFMRDCVNSKDNKSEECEIKTESNMRQIEQTVIPERVSLNTLKCKNDVTDDQKYIISEELCIKTETVENDEGSNRVADVSFQPYSELTSAEIANIASFQHSVFETNYNLNVNLQSIVYRDTSEIAIVNSSQPKPVLQSYECQEPKSYETDTKTQFDEPLSKDVSDQKKHKCKLCGYKAKFKSTVKRHMLIHSYSSNRQDGSKLEMYKCEDCDFETKYKVSLKSHKLVHQEIANMQCTVCNFKTKYASSLKKHILIHKDISEVEMHICGECDYESKYIGCLRAHVLVHRDHSAAKVYDCKACEFKTRHRSSFRLHAKVHQSTIEAKMLRCADCNFETKHKSCLVKHMLIHQDISEVKLYECEICNLKTKHRESLTRHMSSHRNEVMRCELCQYKTKRKSQLVSHMLVHRDPSKIKMYDCGTCPFKTKRKSSWKKHMLNHRESVKRHNDYDVNGSILFGLLTKVDNDNQVL